MSAKVESKKFGKGTRSVPHHSEKAQKWYPAEDEAKPRKVCSGARFPASTVPMGVGLQKRGGASSVGMGGYWRWIKVWTTTTTTTVRNVKWLSHRDAKKRRPPTLDTDFAAARNAHNAQRTLRHDHQEMGNICKGFSGATDMNDELTRKRHKTTNHLKQQYRSARPSAPGSRARPCSPARS